MSENFETLHQKGQLSQLDINCDPNRQQLHPGVPIMD